MYIFSDIPMPENRLCCTNEHTFLLIISLETCKVVDNTLSPKISPLQYTILYPVLLPDTTPFTAH
jgi:hypothetical protein